MLRGAAHQAEGPNNVHEYGQSSNAWAPKIEPGDTKEQFLNVIFLCGFWNFWSFHLSVILILMILTFVLPQYA